MKKWMFLYIMAGIALLTAGTLLRVSDAGNQAERIAGQPESSASSGAVNEPDAAYLLVQSEGDGSWDAVTVGSGRKNCRILGTVDMDMTYYLYCYRDDQGVWYYNVDRYDPTGGTGWEEVSVPVRTEKELPLAFGGAEGQLFCVVAEKEGKSVREYALTVTDPASGWQETREIPAPGEYRLRLAAYEAGRLSLCAEDGTVYHYQDGDVTVQKGLEGTVFAENRNVMDEAAVKAWKGVSMWKAAGKILLPGLLLFFFFGVLLFGLLHRGSPVRRMFSLSVGVLSAALLAAGVLSAVQNRERSLAEAVSQTERTLESLWEKVQGDGRIAGEEIAAAVEQSDGILTDIMLLDGAAVPTAVVISTKLPEMMPVTACYGEDLESLAAEAGNRYDTVEGTISFRGQENPVVLMRNQDSFRSDMVLAGILSGASLSEKQEEQEHMLLHQLSVLFLIGLAVLGLAFLVLGTAWNRFAAALMSLAGEKSGYQLPDKAPPGMQGLWKSLAEISRNREEVHYEKHQNFRSYYRFTPGKMEKLLGKQDLSEVEVGDSVQVNGLLAQLSLQSRNEPDGERYQKFVTRGFEIMSQVLEEKKGILVSQDADFDRFKLLFLERPEEAVRFGIDAVQAYEQDALLQPAEKLILIHASSFLYGVSGTKERAIPFLYAKEEELLDSYIEPLRRAGVKLVLTENVLEKLSDEFVFRYIGFVKKAGEERSMKLYECLDACEERQRHLRGATAESFERALQLFYSNDFYLARNTFNEVLKSNPEDQITRWYLFNCEYHLNTAGDAEVAYGLFENRMLEQQYQTM